MTSPLFTSKIKLEALLYRLQCEAMKDSRNRYNWKRVKKISKKLNAVNRDISARCRESQCHFIEPKPSRFHVINHSKDSLE